MRTCTAACDGLSLLLATRLAAFHDPCIYSWLWLGYACLGSWDGDDGDGGDDGDDGDVGDDGDEGDDGGDDGDDGDDDARGT